MLKNYLKIALRTLKRQKGYAFINIAGLAVGLAACILIGGWVRHELSYDDFHEKADRIYSVVLNNENERGEIIKIANTQPVLGHMLQTEGLPSVQKAARLWRLELLFRHEGQAFYERGLFRADPEVLQIFSFPLLRGDPETALEAPGSVVLTETLARKYFGNESPIGQTISTDGEEGKLTVTGVMKDVPEASHLQFDALISMATYEEDDGLWRNWDTIITLTYVLLPEGQPAQRAEAQLNRLLNEHTREDAARKMEYVLEPLTSIHLRSEYRGPGATGSITNVYIFSLVALFILGIACVNYMNLATAQSARRAKEVGLRKTVGAGRSEVAGQFLMEAVLLVLPAGLLALGLARLALPAFEGLAGTQIGFLQTEGLLAFTSVIVSVGLLAGTYPALVLSGFKPADVLRGTAGTAGQHTKLRKGLVVLQFGIAIALIACTAVVFSQLDYMRRQDLGFAMRDGGQLLTINFNGADAVQAHLEAIKRRLEQHPAVTGVTASAMTPGPNTRLGRGGTLERRDGVERRAEISPYMVDEDFLDVYGIDLVAGHGFLRAEPSDSSAAYILNETAVQENGFHHSDEAIGRTARFGVREGRVAGVVEDFHTAGLQQDIAPLVLLRWPERLQMLTLRLQTDEVQRAVEDLAAIWQEVAPGLPFDYRFLDEQFAAQYRAEVRFGRIFGFAAGLAIFIACLGLFGLAAYAAERRTKEIGIRKVLGASVPSLVALLSKDFLKLVGIAFVIAAPVAYYAMSRWLTGFAYRIDLGAGVFVLAGVLALVIALATVSYQAIKAALTNPIEALRDE